VVPAHTSGLSTNFGMMIIVRCLSGALNGNVAVVRAALGDITDETNSTDAFALYGLTWTVGSILGNAIGGVLSHPYERFPRYFGAVELFRIHPYIFPCLVTAGITVVGIIFTSLYLRESVSTPVPPILSMKLFSAGSRHRRTSSSVSSMSDTETLVDPESPSSPSTERLLAKTGQGIDPHDFDEPSTGEWTFRRLMAYRPIQVVSVTMFLNAFVSGAWGAASLLFFFDRNKWVSRLVRGYALTDSGLGMSASAIGTALAVNGFWTIACQLLLLNRFRRYFGISLSFKILSFGWILVWVMLPLLRSVLEGTETPLPQASSYDPIRYPESRGWMTSIGVNLLLCFVSVVGMSNSLLMVLVNFSCPEKTAYGAVNGISTAVGCMARVLGPSLVSAVSAEDAGADALPLTAAVCDIDGRESDGRAIMVDLHGRHVGHQLCLGHVRRGGSSPSGVAADTRRG